MPRTPSRIDSTHAGKSVIVRDFRGSLLVRTICFVDREAVFVTDTTGWIKLQLHHQVTPIGFHKDDTFLYDSVALHDHTRLQPWKDNDAFQDG